MSRCDASHDTTCLFVYLVYLTRFEPARVSVPARAGRGTPECNVLCPFRSAPDDDEDERDIGFSNKNVQNLVNVFRKRQAGAMLITIICIVVDLDAYMVEGRSVADPAADGFFFLLLLFCIFPARAKCR